MQYEADATRSPMVFVSPAEHRKVVFASTLGTIFEWYDFTLYAALAPFFASLFFPPGNATAALLAAFATYAAGFLIRPVGALVFGHIGDRDLLFEVVLDKAEGLTYRRQMGHCQPFSQVHKRLSRTRPACPRP